MPSSTPSSLRVSYDIIKKLPQISPALEISLEEFSEQIQNALSEKNIWLPALLSFKGEDVLVFSLSRDIKENIQKIFQK
jgi:hypothetical protein